MDFITILKAIVLGIVEGVTEWLPISSTGHMILIDEFLKLNMSKEFMEMFLVVIQLGAIFAVVLLFWNKLWPFGLKEKYFIKQDIMISWFKIIVACIPAAIIELLWGDYIEAMFYNPLVVSIMLILVGILFIIVENLNKNKNSKVNTLAEISFLTAFLIGVFQVVAAVFPGTSRSGATILGAIAIGVSRSVAAEFTFLLAVPVMFGASFIKLLKFGFAFTQMELIVLLVGMITAFLVSIFVIKFLMDYIKKHDFKVFGWYRIILGIIVIAYFMLLK
jgi:undecaprenyl-diphosphatase